MLYPNSIVECDGKNLRQFVWVSLGWNNGPQIFNPRTTMHETGHMMGLADYYDYDNDYFDNGVSYQILKNTQTNKYVFGIAWIVDQRPDNEVQTWYGADPSIM